MVGSGDRSEKIRTYNFPQNSLTDHRINLTLYQLDRIMDGDMDEVLTALDNHYQAEALKKSRHRLRSFLTPSSRKSKRTLREKENFFFVCYVVNKKG